jgi:hypothetical protein
MEVGGQSMMQTILNLLLVTIIILQEFKEKITPQQKQKIAGEDQG